MDYLYDVIDDEVFNRYTRVMLKPRRIDKNGVKYYSLRNGTKRLTYKIVGEELVRHEKTDYTQKYEEVKKETEDEKDKRLNIEHIIKETEEDIQELKDIINHKTKELYNLNFKIEEKIETIRNMKSNPHKEQQIAILNSQRLSKRCDIEDIIKDNEAKIKILISKLRRYK